MNKKRNKRRVAKRNFVEQFQHIDFDPVEWDHFIHGIIIPRNDEPYYDCCKGCANWKGAMTVCNCILPTIEMQRRTY